MVLIPLNPSASGPKLTSVSNEPKRFTKMAANLTACLKKLVEKNRFAIDYHYGKLKSICVEISGMICYHVWKSMAMDLYIKSLILRTQRGWYNSSNIYKSHPMSSSSSAHADSVNGDGFLRINLRHFKDKTIATQRSCIRRWTFEFGWIPITKCRLIYGNSVLEAHLELYLFQMLSR